MNDSVMTPEEFAKQMTEIAEKYGDDEEVCYICMDGLLCEVLESLGYGEGVAVFNETYKWYA